MASTDTSMETVRMFKYTAMGALLAITTTFALLPLWISSRGTRSAQNVLSRKLPFATAGVFLGSGLLHLLPDAVKLYDQVVIQMDAPPHWMTAFPIIYMLCALGCTIVWSVDLLNMGNSGKLMAVASAARPDYETSMYRVQIPSVTSFGWRNRSTSVDGKERFYSCTCDSVPTPSLFHRAAKMEETTCLLTPSSVKVVNGGVLPMMEHESAASELLEEDNPNEHETTVSEHVVFSGDSYFLPYLLAALFSIHSLIAGFALGVNHSLDRTAVATTVAIFSHKFIEATSVGANFAKAKSSIAHRRSIAVLTLYSCMTPLGIFMGMVLSDSLRGTHALTMEALALSIASGSFIYLAFHELSEESASQETNVMEKLVLFSIGILSMAVLAAWA
ncbi:zinc (zn2)-iron (fe2) permease family [Plasmopara halstedii]|uniref:Zinc (Zn2 )-iron (Fe2 ) permease family n=1 Tax=Plasmopara halstedii TaxID=4781 RepID=A0A0N7L5E1_PLAHL|nr:zinc (zn2)-iron (fe2) permease family [Plasmopara halstedii]CEG41219.1 zinc (zn2)-iron (fe2) permease family [Plasmopara halstedii]|eukprot:XP_024577588.1 zinc (zn2)-iron (fe2) permease family [Plasmopara halstedii]